MSATATDAPARCIRCGEILDAGAREGRLCILHAAIYGTVEGMRFCDWLTVNGIRLDWQWTAEKGHHAEVPDEIWARWEEERAFQEAQREPEPCLF